MAAKASLFTKRGRKGRVVEAWHCPAHGEARFGEIHVHHMAGAGLGRRDADAAGVGEHVEHGFFGGFGHDAAARGAQVEEQPRVLAAMAGLDVVLDAQFGKLPQGFGAGQALGRQRVADPGVGVAAVVVDMIGVGEGLEIEGLQGLLIGWDRGPWKLWVRIRLP
jgi:hypothetical protein